MITGKILGDKYVINDISAAVSGFRPDMTADIYYEVIRLIDGKLLFLPDHLERLQRSLSESGIMYPGNARVMDNLKLLLLENTLDNGNIRISLQASVRGDTVLQCYFIPYFYPDPLMYKNGVRLKIYPHIRPNPGVKKWDDSFRNSVSNYILEHGVYEVALKNNQNQITEGSRSNLFFIDTAGKLISTPGKDILPGITRKYVLGLAESHGIPMEERILPADSLSSLVSAFISGTSPKVLPVKQIEDLRFDVDHPVLRLLMDQFDRLVGMNLSSL